METWYTEPQTENLRWSARIGDILFHQKSHYQDVLVVDTPQFGRLLALDGLVQTTERDEFIYHEMLAHVTAGAHPQPERALVIGGGDGGVVRELLRDERVKHVDLVEIDGLVVETCKRFFPTIAGKLEDPRVTVHIEDGIQFIARQKGLYDVIIVDSSEPIGPGVGLFEGGFYEGVHAALKEDGLMVAQTESPFYNADVIARAWRGISRHFPIVRLYTAAVPTYPSGLWTMTVGSKRHDPTEPKRSTPKGTRYYTDALHRASFVLPRFVAEIVEQALAEEVHA